jgi:hypothetical protein
MKVIGVPCRCSFAVDGVRHGCGIPWTAPVEKIPEQNGKHVNFFISQKNNWCMCSVCFERIFGDVYGLVDPLDVTGTETWFLAVQKDPLFNERTGRWSKSASRDNPPGPKTWKRPAACDSSPATKRSAMSGASLDQDSFSSVVE